MLDMATREIFWQVSNRWVFYVLALASLAALLWGMGRGLRFIRRGAAVSRESARSAGLRSTLADVLSQSPLAGGEGSRWWHSLIFYGFVVLVFVTCYLMLAHYVHEGLFTGIPYLLISLLGDLAGAAVVAGVILALVTIRRDPSPARDRTRSKILILLLLGAVCLTGFLVEGLRIRVQGDAWRSWSPVGAAVAGLFPEAGATEPRGQRLFQGLWWLHTVLALAFLAWIPFSGRLRHLLFLPFHRAGTPVEPRSPAPFLDLQALRNAGPAAGTVRLGIERPADATRGQRLGLLACMDCGRCERLCPALETGQPLTPRKYLQDLRNFVLEAEGEGQGNRQGEPPCSVSEAMTPAALWACRLCRACEELCPAGIGHVPQLLEVRRAEVQGHGRLPDDGAVALRSLARTGNPYGSSRSERASWIRDQRVPGPPADPSRKPLLLWTGCFQPGDEQKPRVLSCLVRLLRKFDVPFFIPEDTACCGDPARILGEEDLFQALARQQIARIEASGAERVLVHCPHCYTALKDVYPLLGARFSVLHTSELLHERIEKEGLGGQGFPNPLPVVYHDPCFLSRYQELAEPPRAILDSIPGIERRTLPRSGRQGYCCGAGGGHFFMDLDLQERPASQRLQEVIVREPEVLAVACGFCFSMFDDALRRLPNTPSLRIADWLELLEEASEKPVFADEASG